MTSQFLKSTSYFLALVATFSVVQSWAADKEESSTPNANGDNYLFSVRTEKRESTRWTLQGWIDQRDRNRMMDLWLSLHSPSPFEVMLGGSYNSLALSGSGVTNPRSYNDYAGEFAAYAQFVGLSVEYQNDTPEGFNDLSGLFNIRLLGNSLQNTSLTFSAGERTRTSSASGTNLISRNEFVQSSLKIYLSKTFGLQGKYRYYQPTDSGIIGDKLGGNLSEAGLFIDFKALRVFGVWATDTETDDLNSVKSSTIRQGIKAGLEIYY